LEELYDVAIEALSYLWLRFPEMLLEVDCRSDLTLVLNVVSQDSDTDNSLPWVQDETKARILQTINRFLGLFE
jgi:hypothetical protein